MLTHKKLKEAAGTQAFILALQKEIKNQEEHCTNKRRAAKAISAYKREIERLQNQRNEVLQEDVYKRQFIYRITFLSPCAPTQGILLFRL